MSISRVDSSHAQLTGDSRPRQREPRVGDQVQLSVLQRLDETRYQVGFADGWRVVASTVALPVGATIWATVTAVGDKLELRYTGGDAVAAAMTEHEAKSEDALVEHEKRFRVALPEIDRTKLQAALRDAEDVETMMDSGLFLGKLAVPLDAPKLQAVYESQRWSESGGTHARQAGAQSVLSGNDVDQLAAAVEQALREPPTTVTASDASSSQAFQSGDDAKEDDRRQLAWQLLNDQDGGSVEYRYGVLPLIIADQLFELDLVYFRDRHSSAEASTHSKRMVMTLNAPSLGRVEVLAQSIGDRLTVTIKSDSEASRQILSAEQERVRELLARLGWGVDGVTYEVDGIDTRAAAHVVDHVLSGDSLSRWV
jgi:hypothetical protein